MKSKEYLYNYIKKQIDNMEYFNSQLKLKKVGLVYRCSCPFHQERTPSFTLYPVGYTTKNEQQEYASFYCFGCGVSGDIIKFKQLKDNINSYYEAALELANEYNIKIEDEINIKTNYLQTQITKQQDVMLSLDKINLTCSTIMRNYLKLHNNEQSIKKINKFSKYLDNELEERNAIEAQSLIDETINYFKE